MFPHNTHSAETNFESHDTHTSRGLSAFQRVGIALGALGLTSGLSLATAEAAAGEEMSPSQASRTCEDNIRVVAHGSANQVRRTTFDVNTKGWITQEIKSGHNIIEVDAQISANGQSFAFHDRMLNANTRNGVGVAHRRSSDYIFGLRTLHGGRLSAAADFIKILRRNPKVSLQHEFKDYDHQWTDKRLDAWYEMFSEADVLDQINVSSASPRVIKLFTKKYGDVTDKQLIGFGNRLPSLRLAKQVGATQVNVTSEAGLRQNARYIKRAQKMGFRTSVRSNPNGAGDTGSVWLKAIESGVDQIVTQGPTKYFVCNAVRRAARNK